MIGGLPVGRGKGSDQTGSGSRGQENAASSGILLFWQERPGAGLAVFGFDPNNIVFIHKQHCLGAVFSLDIGKDDEGVIGLCKKICHPCLDSDVDFPLPCDTVRGFDANPSILFLVNVFALLQGLNASFKKIPANGETAGRHLKMLRWDLFNSLIYLGIFGQDITFLMQACGRNQT